MSGIELRVYEPDARTLLGVVRDVVDTACSDEFNEPGSGKVTIPIDGPDVDLLQYDRVVGVWYEGKERFKWIVEKITEKVAAEGGDRTLEVSGRGLLAWLADAIVYPQSGSELDNYAAEERVFGYGSEGLATSTWVAPKGIKWSADTSGRKKKPEKWPDNDAQWIWITDPTQNVPEKKTVWFRKTFSTTAAATKVRFYLAADDEAELMLDGAVIATASGFEDLTKVTKTLGPGQHILAAKATNGDNPDSGKNLAGLLVSVRKVGGAVMVRSDTSWKCTDVEPELQAPVVLRNLIFEARARGVWKPGRMPAGTADLFTVYAATTDETGKTWPNTVDGQWTLTVGTDLLDVVTTIVDYGIDLYLDPVALKLKAWDYRGTERPEVLLAAGKNLLDMSVERSSRGRNTALVRFKNNWTEVENAPGVTAYGRREVLFSYPRQGAKKTVTTAATARIKRYARIGIVVTGQSYVPTGGDIPWDSYAVGDTIRVLDRTGKPFRARVLSITLESNDAGQALVTPELEVWASS